MPGAELKPAVFTIRQLCREFGVTARALRFYEDKGLLHPARRGQTRVYAARDRARLRLILRGKRVGFSLIEIRDLLDLYDRKDGGVTQMAVSLKRFQDQLLTLKRQREDLEGAIETLESGCAWLQEQLAAVPAERLPRADDYDALLRARLGDAHDDFDDDYRPRKPARARI